MSGDEVVERVMVQDIGAGVTHRIHHILYWTLRMLGIRTVLAFQIGRLAHASDGSERPIQNANDLAERNRSWRLNQCIAPLHPSSARKKAGSFQSQENLFKKLDRDMLASRDVMAL